VSSRPARHRRADQSRLGPAQLLARLSTPGAVTAPPVTEGWVPDPPVPPAAPRPPVRELPGVRWGPSGRAVAGVAGVLLVAVLVAVLTVWRAQPSAEAVPALRRSGSDVVPEPQGPVTAARASPGGDVVVHVVGAVREPGLVRVPTGARVADAVRAAGGLQGRALAASVNLARPVVDGEQIVVQRRGGVPLAGAAPAPPAGTTPRGGAAPVDLNTATVDVLDALPGIGPVLAQRILDWRTAHGRFSTVDELGEVAGIGEVTLGELRPLVTV
jgi:competence protein ComEA